ncbi:PREDICTED: arrestin domain-containing protein 3-like [Poecilia mexicana]|uniref:arrestin domain-containing protein 3-like n=1 Tax=Poecilia mexicana TaxID=48701 RepID=UPI00072E16C4|nr:PREDICTED: arrestin domain-containing protein 3-like [Poecilia mexicana]
MSSTIKKIEITYNSINASNTFTNGDIVSGQVSVEAAKDCQISSFYIKFKGKADVFWTETYGQNTYSYHAKDKYFSVRQYFIRDPNSKEIKPILFAVQTRPPTVGGERRLLLVSGFLICCRARCVNLVRMSSTIKKIEITYNSINASNTFTNGDIVSGQVSVEAAKDCQISSFYIKFKGKADVFWTERHGQTTQIYHAKDKYFSVRQYFIRDPNSKDDQKTLIAHQSGETYSNVVPPGIHVYPFSFQLPLQNIPSTFKGADGKIVYLLEAVLSRSMRMDSKESTMINFVAKGDLNPVSGLMVFLTSVPCSVSLDVRGLMYEYLNYSDHFLFLTGEGLKVKAFIKNDSSREIKPKYCIYRKHSFFARGRRRVHTKDLIKEVGRPIPPKASENVTQVIAIPQDVEPSILNCSIIKAEHRLRVYLDVKYASDPEIKFDIIILPAHQVPAVATAPTAASDFGIGPFGSYGNPNPPVWGFGPQQPPPAYQPAGPPPPYGAHGMYPPLNEFDHKY